MRRAPRCRAPAARAAALCAARGVYERQAIYAILDQALICHVGFVVPSENGVQPVVIPTIHVRAGDALYFHGSAASRMLRSLRDGVDACVTVTILDGWSWRVPPFTTP